MTLHDDHDSADVDPTSQPPLAKRSRSDATISEPAAADDINSSSNDDNNDDIYVEHHPHDPDADPDNAVLVKSEAVKTESNVVSVMPPSAKTILERRAKAMREGRRKDAKLTEAERRIVRRLRNRESAERCRLRRVRQAAMMEQRMVQMQHENERLTAEAESYRKAISHYQSIIATFSHRATSQTATACVPAADNAVAVSQGLCEQLVGGADN